jgi:hypothetical protein
MATTIEILKELTKQTNTNSKNWKSIVDGLDNHVMAEEQRIDPSINIEDGTYFAYVKLQHSNLVPNTFSGKIISAGQENQIAKQISGNQNLILTDIGNSTVKVSSVKLDVNQGSLMLQWTGCNIYSPELSCGKNSEENAHKLVATYYYQKKDSNLGTLGQIYTWGITPWSPQLSLAEPEFTIINDSQRGCAVINSPKIKNSVIKTLKFLSYKGGVLEWILEPDSSSNEGKELINLYNSINKQIAQPFALEIL